MVAAREVARRGKLSDPIRWRLAELNTGLEVGRLLCYRTAYLQSIGQVPNYEASMAKVYGTEWSQRMMAVAMQMIGMDGIGHHADTLARDIAQGYRQAVSRTIAGGTSEIQRNIVATRGLGLPRS